jgi:hypothetical protein
MHTINAYMSTKRAHVLVPEDLLQEIDALVGPRGRSSFLVETARREVRRQKLLHFLEGENEPVWKSKDHPELAAGAAGWVRKLRAESEARNPRERTGTRGRSTRPPLTL